MFVHLTLVPYIPAAGEMKTKPTQHSVKELRSIGIQPDVLLCRADRPIPDGERGKIALFTNVAEEAVIAATDVSCIYDLPRLLHSQKLDELVVRQFGMQLPGADLSDWNRVVDGIMNPAYEVTVGMVGKYTELTESYKSLNEALVHAGVQNRCRVNIEYLDASAFKNGDTSKLDQVDAILVPGGFGLRGVEGKIAASRVARERKIPYLGICLGMQVAVIDFARHCAGIDSANSSEFDGQTENPVIALITEWQQQDGSVEQRDEDSDLGGTMRLGGQRCELAEGSLAAQVYGQSHVTERHRHRYEFNNNYRSQLEQAGLVISATSSGSETLVEMIELADHPWFIGCQFHPEYTSTPRFGHPLFTGFISAALEYSNRHAKQDESVSV